MTPNRTKLAFGILALLLAVVLSPSAVATSISVSGPLTAAGFNSLNTAPNPNPDYTPPAPFIAHATSASGPLVFDSGDLVTLYRGPNPAVNEVGDPANVLVLLSFVDSPAGVISMDFATPTDLAAVNLTPSNFFLNGGTPPLNFPTNGGLINGIPFNSAYHGGVILTYDDLNTLASGAVASTLRITTPVALRVDFFGLRAVKDSTGNFVRWDVANNSSNSMGFAVNPPIPEPATLVLFGIGMSALAALRKRSRTA